MLAHPSDHRCHAASEASSAFRAALNAFTIGSRGSLSRRSFRNSL